MRTHKHLATLAVTAVASTGLVTAMTTPAHAQEARITAEETEVTPGPGIGAGRIIESITFRGFGQTVFDEIVGSYEVRMTFGGSNLLLFSDGQSVTNTTENSQTWQVLEEYKQTTLTAEASYSFWEGNSLTIRTAEESFHGFAG
ncbi:hypothetical protein JL108_19470 [Aeromicrobium sp. YIM 150415]|uniref:hypothetical protein n=1 Tax=Aeromicrobium sp. YIM 150415 TaxID=2803912 RepID=UPI001962B973|nr:hypothetical protein [Aeromicrobium sp. YIM 150415]MBM9465636.1 hypothetical protein [Aeromicrobium sp. YIM 150415]